MQILIDSATSHTSPPYSVPGSGPYGEVWIGIEGGGPVYIETQTDDGDWHRYPELTFTESAAGICYVKRGRMRIVVDAATATSVVVELEP